MGLTQAPITLFQGETPEVAEYHLANNSAVALVSAVAPDKQTVNEDAACVIPVDDECVILAVADGAGGAPCGDLAARIAIESLVAETTKDGDLPIRASILNGFETANETILRDIPGAATTLVVVEITNQVARTYHVGDSGAWIVGGRGKTKLHTVFHSPTGYAFEAGLLSEQQAISHEDRHLVSNVLGDAGMSVAVGSPISLAPRDTIVLASDGMFDNMYREEIASTACRDSLKNACQHLAEFAAKRMLSSEKDAPSKPDDLTILLYRNRRDQSPA